MNKKRNEEQKEQNHNSENTEKKHAQEFKQEEVDVEDKKRKEEVQKKESKNQDEMQDKIEELEFQLEELEKRKEEIEIEKNNYLEQVRRLQADFENYKKRVAKEWERKSQEKTEALVCDILPILDNFQRALENAVSNQEVDENYHQGVKMIYEQMYEVLKKHGLEKIEAEGAKFDPNYHEAVMQVESEELEKDTVVEELQPGFIFQGKLLRASMVKVAK